MTHGPDGKRWPWGRITEVHSIGPYDIVEFIWKDIKGGLAGKRGFGVFVAGRDAGISAPTLDGALLLAIAYRAEGGKSTSAALYMTRMLGLETPN